jgi:hypothetical protein
MKILARLAVFLLLAGCALQPSAPPQTVTVIVFPGGFNWPIWVAQHVARQAPHAQPQARN